jgi:hypothetical protein
VSKLDGVLKHLNALFFVHGTRVCLRYRRVYEAHGSKGSALYVVPFNQGSSADVTSLVAYVHDDLGMELDFIVR